jgi:hypothetical protein
MPELSTNFEFTINGSDTVQVNHPGDSTTEEYISAKVKGDGYYKGGDGYHTMSFKLSDFIGKLTVQGTLAIEPTADDWFDVELLNPNSLAGYSVDATGAVEVGVEITELDYTDKGTTISKIYNFTGNFVWVRVKVDSFVQGTINHIRMNY